MENMRIDISHERGLVTRSPNWRELPQVIGDTAAPTVSRAYQHYSTREILELAESHGFEPLQALAAKKRDRDRQQYAKHQVTVIHRDIGVPGEGNLTLWIRNAFDGSSSLQILLGFYRAICSNSLLTGSSIGSWRVRHSGSLLDVHTAIRKAVEHAPTIAQRIALLQTLETSPSDRTDWRIAVAERLVQPGSRSQIRASELDVARRDEDRNPSWWALLNRTQENIMRGGISYTTERGHTRRLRGVRGLDRSVKVNQMLWNLAEQMSGIN